MFSEANQGSLRGKRRVRMNHELTQVIQQETHLQSLQMTPKRGHPTVIIAVNKVNIFFLYTF